MGRLRIFMMLVVTFFLTACAAVPLDRSAFYADFVRINTHIDQYESAIRLDYTPRVKGRGIDAVNSAVNTMPYLPDRIEKHVLDAEKFWRRGGDCEEYALKKMLELHAQGFNDLYYLVAINPATQGSHAVIALENDGRMVILDNRAKTPMPIASLYNTYKPAYFVETHTGRVWRSKKLAEYAGTQMRSVVAAPQMP